ncbi:hypothetical protein COP2_035701 [Malus domestica]
MSTFTLHGKADIHNILSSPRNGFPTNPLDSLSVLHPMGYLCKQIFKSKSISYHEGRKQEYLISCILHVLFLVFVLTCRTRRRKAISQHLVSIFRSGTDCLQPLPDCLHGIALEYSFSTADVLPKKLPHLPGEHIRQAKMIPAAEGV